MSKDINNNNKSLKYLNTYDLTRTKSTIYKNTLIIVTFVKKLTSYMLFAKIKTTTACMLIVLMKVPVAER